MKLGNRSWTVARNLPQVLIPGNQLAYNLREDARQPILEHYSQAGQRPYTITPSLGLS